MKKFFLIVLSICLTSTAAFAGHVDTYGIGSRATSMAGAMTAGTNDAFSVYYNPAAMTRIKKKTFTIGSHFVDPSLKIEKFNADMSSNAYPAIGDATSPGSVEDESPLLIVPHLGYVHPLNDKVTLGFAVYVPYGLELTWNANTAENAAAYNTYHSWYMREVITPSIAYKVNDKLSLGFGVSIGKSEAGVERVRYVPDFMTYSAAWESAGFQPAEAAYLAASYSDLAGSRYKTEMEDDFNYSFNIGVLYEFNEKLSVGATFRSKSNTHMEGEIDVAPTPTYWNNYNVDASVDIDTPNQLQVGIQYSPTPKWNINFDITRTWWGSIEDYSVQFNPAFMATPVLAPDGAQTEYYERDWKDTFQYRLGVEYKLNKTVDLRAGYYYDPTVVPNNTFDVQWPDSNKHVFSGGMGLHFGDWTVDLVLQYVKIEPIKINGESHNLNETFYRPGVHTSEVEADASGHLLAYGVTVSYSF